MKLSIIFTDNLGYEIRSAQLYNEDRVMFGVYFSKGSNSRSMGSYNVAFNGKFYFSMAGTISAKEYAKKLSKGLLEMGFELSAEDVLTALGKKSAENKREHNKTVELKREQNFIEIKKLRVRAVQLEQENIKLNKTLIN